MFEKRKNLEDNASLTQTPTSPPTSPTLATLCPPSTGWRPTNLLRWFPPPNCDDSGKGRESSLWPICLLSISGNSTRQAIDLWQKFWPTTTAVSHKYILSSIGKKHVKERDLVGPGHIMTNLIVPCSGLARLLARPGWGVGGFCWKVFPTRPCKIRAFQNKALQDKGFSE